MIELSIPQKALYNLHRFCGNGIANITADIFFDHCPEDKVLNDAYNKLIELCATYRSYVVVKEGIPYLKTRDYVYENYPRLEFATREEYLRWVEEESRKSLPIQTKMYRLYIVLVEGKRGVFFILHHMLGDAWGLTLMATFFNDMVMRGDAEPIQNYDFYLESERKYLESKKYQADRAYWLEMYDRHSDMNYLRDLHTRDYTSRRLAYALTREETAYLKAQCKNLGITEYVAFLSAAAAYFYRVTQKEAFCLGTPVRNRFSYAEKHSAGAFMNTVPAFVAIREQESFGSLSEQMLERVGQLFRHQKCAYSEVLQILRQERNHELPLFDVVVSVQSGHYLGEAKTTWYHSGSQMENLQIHIDDRDDEGFYHIYFDYLLEKFTESEINAMFGHFKALLFGGVTSPKTPLSQLDFLAGEERERLLSEFNDTACPYTLQTVPELFAHQVEKTPTRTAVVFEGRELTYRQLEERANALAHRLAEQGIGTGDIVPIIAKRSDYVLVAMLGVLKTGAAYMPVDPAYPPERIAYMIGDAGCRLALCYGFAQELSVPTIDLEEVDYTLGTENLPVKAGVEDACYVVYTSGSTGKPKGVMVPHRSVANYVAENPKNVMGGIVPADCRKIVSVTNIIFDIFVTESILALVNGLTVYFATEEETYRQEKLAALVEKYGIEIIQTTPTKLQSLIRDRERLDYLKRLKVIILGGEAFPPEMYGSLRAHTDAAIYNVYGPSETTVWSTLAPVDSADIVIGKPIANTQVYLVDGQLQPVPIGAVGELCIGGDGVVTGYLNRPELTAERFVDNPFGAGKLYRTGDLARWREDGNLVYIGRNDFQVKIRGLRIELGEIEMAMTAVPGVELAVVVVRKNSSGRQMICAFYTGREQSNQELRATLSQGLPQYMIPHVFTHLEEMPLTGSGKLNRGALPTVDLDGKGAETTFVAPRTETERQLCAVMEKVIGTAPIGIEDHFFDIGGDSLKAIELITLAAVRGIRLGLQEVFEYPTVKKMAEQLANPRQQDKEYTAAAFAQIHELLAKSAEVTRMPQEEPLGEILLVGATGFLGIHVLEACLAAGAKRVYCLVRGDQGEARLQQLLDYYFDGRYALGENIRILAGEITAANLGLAEIPRVDTVVNCAATVKHYGTYDSFYQVNTLGAIHVMEVAESIGARFLHVSTISVSGVGFLETMSGSRSREERHFTEKDLYVGQSLDNVYIRSKFEAESAILEAIAENRIQGAVVRVGNLTNRRRDMRFQPNYQSNAFLRRVKAIYDLGMFSEDMLGQYAEFSPVDDTALAIVEILKHFSTEKVMYHVYHPDGVYFDRLMADLGDMGHPMTVHSAEDFRRKMEEAAGEEATRSIYEALVNDLDEEGNLSYDANIRISGENTVGYLQQAGFSWEEIGKEYVQGYIRYFRELGYLQ